MNKIFKRLSCALALAGLVAAPVAFAVDKPRAKDKPRVSIKYPAKSAARKGARPHVAIRAKHNAEPDIIAGSPNLKSSSALVFDLEDGQAIYGKNTQNRTPIASITKLMTSMVVLDANLPQEETIYIDAADYDSIKHTGSRLGMGTGLPRREMLRLALMSSENRAAASLARAYPGGTPAFVAAMNRKAGELSMTNTRFVDSTGLSSDNVSTAEDLVKMVKGAYEYALIREYTTTSAHEVETSAGRSLQFRNSNGLVRAPNSSWEIGLSKTGYISEAGRCLVMQAKIAARPVIIVLLDSWGKQTRIGDANRIKKWLETKLERKPVG
ncbi:MAG: D-alanyl-D-alanine endopeptidase [Betaproteobacteria bacterium]|nr:D-alanyl-D-alanine endopeptidase [Betaproteobacteria bacterium]